MPKKTWLVKGSKHRSFPDAIVDEPSNILLYAMIDGKSSATGYYLHQCYTNLHAGSISCMLASIGPLCAQQRSGLVDVKCYGRGEPIVPRKPTVSLALPKAKFVRRTEADWSPMPTKCSTQDRLSILLKLNFISPSTNFATTTTHHNPQPKESNLCILVIGHLYFIPSSWLLA